MARPYPAGGVSIAQRAGAPAPSLLFPTVHHTGFASKERRCGDVLSAVNEEIHFFRARLFTSIKWWNETWIDPTFE